MKIALLGYGKMGKVIEKIALQRGHEIVLKKSSTNTFEGLEKADIAIEFSVPTVAVNNITESLKAGVPVISGTTGWLENYDKMVALCEKENTAFIYSSNFSLGVNVFFEMNEHLAKIMSKLNEYTISMEEIHHIQKIDKPSGTAITLANGIINNSKYESWTLENPNLNQILIDAKRKDHVPGTHAIFYSSTFDTIEIKHTAHSRDGFALGAIIAAEWILGKKGVFSMKDVLSLS